MAPNVTMDILERASPTSTPAHVVRTRIQEISIGMILLGVVFSSILYGVMITQTQKYYERFKKDQRMVKALVFAVFILNTASVVLICHAGWYYLVTTGMPSRSVWSLNVELLLSMVMSGLTETFLAFRVYRLSGNNMWLLGLLISLVLFHFISGEVAAIKLLSLKAQAKVFSAELPTILRLSSAALCDTVIAGALSFFLHKKRTGFKRSDEMIDYLILFSINSGILLCATSVGSLVLYLAVPDTWVYTAICFTLSRLYATTFLSSLNSRMILYSDHDEVSDSPLPKGKASSDPALPPGLSVEMGVLRRYCISFFFLFPPSLIFFLHSPPIILKTPTQIYIVTETITDNMVPQILSPTKIRAMTGNNQMREASEGSSRSSSSSDSRPQSPTN